MIELYRVFDDLGRLLYVGISTDPLRRLSQHRDGKEWWPRVRRVEVQHLDTDDRVIAECIEREAIRVEKPIYNLAGSPVRESAEAERAAAFERAYRSGVSAGLERARTYWDQGYEAGRRAQSSDAPVPLTPDPVHVLDEMASLVDALKERFDSGGAW